MERNYIIQSSKEYSQCLEILKTYNYKWYGFNLPIGTKKHKNDDLKDKAEILIDFTHSNALLHIFPSNTGNYGYTDFQRDIKLYEFLRNKASHEIKNMDLLFFIDKELKEYGLQESHETKQELLKAISSDLAVIENAMEEKSTTNFVVSWIAKHDIHQYRIKTV